LNPQSTLGVVALAANNPAALEALCESAARADFDLKAIQKALDSSNVVRDCGLETRRRLANRARNIATSVGFAVRGPEKFLFVFRSHQHLQLAGVAAIGTRNWKFRRAGNVWRALN
jgi:hypothetical protein